LKKDHIDGAKSYIESTTTSVAMSIAEDISEDDLKLCNIDPLTIHDMIPSREENKMIMQYLIQTLIRQFNAYSGRSIHTPDTDDEIYQLLEQLPMFDFSIAKVDEQKYLDKQRKIVQREEEELENYRWYTEWLCAPSEDDDIETIISDDIEVTLKEFSEEPPSPKDPTQWQFKASLRNVFDESNSIVTNSTIEEELSITPSSSLPTTPSSSLPTTPLVSPTMTSTVSPPLVGPSDSIFESEVTELHTLINTDHNHEVIANQILQLKSTLHDHLFKKAEQIRAQQQYRYNGNHFKISILAGKIYTLFKTQWRMREQKQQQAQKLFQKYL
jgi:muconolactone delta-isomerase